MQHSYFAFLNTLPKRCVVIWLLTALLRIATTRKRWAVPHKPTIDTDVLVKNAAARGVYRRRSCKIFSKHCRKRPEPLSASPRCLCWLWLSMRWLAGLVPVCGQMCCLAALGLLTNHTKPSVTAIARRLWFEATAIELDQFLQTYHRQCQRVLFTQAS